MFGIALHNTLTYQYIQSTVFLIILDLGYQYVRVIVSFVFGQVHHLVKCLFFSFLTPCVLEGSSRHIYTLTKPSEAWANLGKGSQSLNQARRAFNCFRGEPSDQA